MAKTNLEIIYDGDDLLIVNKPAGISSARDSRGKTNVFSLLEEQAIRKIENLKLIYTLDKDSSGALVLAKNKDAGSKYSSMLARQKIKRTFLILCTGFAAQESGIIDKPLHKSKKDNLMKIINKRTKKKEAITKWSLLADFGQSYLIAASPVTKRTHQIRVHMSSIGLPLAIDKSYGGERPVFLSDYKSSYNLGKNQEEKPLINRLTLHCYQLEFTENQQDKPRYFIANLDKDFKATLKMLTKHNSKGKDAFQDSEVFDRILKGEKIF